MAQPVFDEHPLQDYFQGVYRRIACTKTWAHTAIDAGETTEPIPGDFMTEYGGDGAHSPQNSIFARIQVSATGSILVSEERAAQG